MGRTFGWYADKTENECEFEYEFFDEILYTITVTVCFDTAGTVTDVKDMYMSIPDDRLSDLVLFRNWCPDSSAVGDRLEEDLTANG